MKTRLDVLLVEKGIAATRERAQALILAGRVLVNEQKVEKPGTSVPGDAMLRLLGEEMRYVSRGGLKLEAALAHWQIDLRARLCVDVGTSTGGFTDCMLQHGAMRVIAVDTGYGQVAQSLRSDPRVELRERTNARYLEAGDLPTGISFVAMDVSFISATLVLPAVVDAALAMETASEFEAGAGRLELVVLVKPQFEAGREHIGKGGIVRDPAAHTLAIERVKTTVLSLGGRGVEYIDSPILGGEGNREFLLYANFDSRLNAVGETPGGTRRVQ